MKIGGGLKDADAYLSRQWFSSKLKFTTPDVFDDPLSTLLLKIDRMKYHGEAAPDVEWLTTIYKSFLEQESETY